MVFGIGEGKIDIVLEKLDYSPGEMLMGTLKLQLNSPKKARNLRVRFWGERNVKKSRRSAPGTANMGPSSSGRQLVDANEIVYEFTVTLDGEKEYTSGEYPFQIKMPDIPGKTPESLGGATEMAAGIAQTLGLTPSPVRWYIQASLDLPMSLDINKKVQITLG
jgi:sporulation-control protein spo0M